MYMHLRWSIPVALSMSSQNVQENLSREYAQNSHLGLEHTEHEEGMDPNDTGNLMYFQSGARHDGFTAGQAATIRRSLRVQLVPRGTVDRSQPLYRDYPTENGLVERMDQ